MEVATFSLANESFLLGTSFKDQMRRKRHYAGTQDQLTEQETKILRSLGIDEQMENTMKPYMATFFEKLPQCNTDASLRLSRECEVPYYVVWSTLFANRTNTAERFQENKKLPQRSQLNMAIDGAIIGDMKPIQTKRNKYTDLFTLIPAVPVATPISAAVIPTAPPVNSGFELNPITQLFTLIPKP